MQLKKTCTEHGETTVCIASDARFYWQSKGKPENACGGHACRASDLATEGPGGTPIRGRTRIQENSRRALH